MENRLPLLALTALTACAPNPERIAQEELTAFAQAASMACGAPIEGGAQNTAVESPLQASSTTNLLVNPERQDEVETCIGNLQGGPFVSSLQGECFVSYKRAYAPGEEIGAPKGFELSTSVDCAAGAIADARGDQ
jgi:hypothetical protein